MCKDIAGGCPEAIAGTLEPRSLLPHPESNTWIRHSLPVCGNVSKESKSDEFLVLEGKVSCQEEVED